jgi:hypothetical protein
MSAVVSGFAGGQLHRSSDAEAVEVISLLFPTAHHSSYQLSKDPTGKESESGVYKIKNLEEIRQVSLQA